jgi:hypothetical protein
MTKISDEEDANRNRGLAVKAASFDDSDKTDDGSPSASETVSVRSSIASAADGEYLHLIQSAEDGESLPLTKRVETALKRELSQTDLDTQTHVDRLTPDLWYGHPLSPQDASEALPVGKGGMEWYCTIIPDDYFVHGKLKGGLNRKDFDALDYIIKPRRPSLPVTASDFFKSISAVDGPVGVQKRYIFHGVLNGWPCLRTFELESLEQRRNSPALPSPKELLTGQILWLKTWSTDEDGKHGRDPHIVGTDRIYRAKLRGAPWTNSGWSKDSPGFCFWYEMHRKKVSYGVNMLQEIETDPVCTHIHMISHRYAVERETPRNRITYHSICLLEWDHANYCTVVEAAYLNGIGGYKGKSNWYRDRDEPMPQLYRAMPAEMVCPWRSTSAEIRCYDVEAMNLEEFKKYIAEFQGPTKRFVDPHISFSHQARLSFRSKRHIAQYLLNYILRDSKYGELSRNCQTFTADLCNLIAGKKNVAPFHPVSRIEYTNRTHLFLYDSHLFSKNKVSGTR